MLKKINHLHAAHAIIFGRDTTFANPVKKMLRMFAMLCEFQLVTRFFLKRFKKVVPFSRTRAALKFRTKNNVVCSPEVACPTAAAAFGLHARNWYRLDFIVLMLIASSDNIVLSSEDEDPIKT